MVKIQKVICEGQTLIGVLIPPEQLEWREKIKTIVGRRWHPVEKVWSIPYSKEGFAQLKILFDNQLTVVECEVVPHITPPIANVYGKPNPKPPEPTLFDKLNDKQKAAVSKLEELLIEERKAYATRKNYRNHFIHFLWKHSEVLPSQISKQQIRTYIIARIKENTIAPETQNQIVSVMKAFYGRLLGQHDKVSQLHRPKKEEHLPNILTQDEIKRLFEQITNLKHRCLLMLMYGSGLRVGEVVKLKKEDLDFVEKTVFVYRSKGNKDRYTLLSDKSIDYLSQYLEMYKPQIWLFESPEGGHYSERSVQQIFADALKKARINKRVSTHSLRHAFATHLLKAHADLDFVRKVLGHNSILTTQRYLHVLKSEITQTRSPLDDIEL